jgi:hypothetical protein
LKPSFSEIRNYWLWYFGSAVWLIDAALAIHFEHRSQALVAVLVALIFLLAGAIWRSKWNRLQ